MSPVVSLAFPFFGLILLGFFSGKIAKVPEEGMRWMNFFIVYIAVPALFFKLMSVTPFEQFGNWRFILTTTICTYVAFVFSFGIGLIASKGNVREATIQGNLGPIRTWDIWARALRLRLLARNRPCRPC